MSDSTDEIKEQVLRACPHWLLLVVEEMKKEIGSFLRLEAWDYKPREDGYVSLRFRADVGMNFESWAHREWKWDGKFEIRVSWWHTDEEEPDVSWYRDYQIEKRAGENPYVLDCREGQLWMRAR
jgi:hypothetical protein